MSKIPAMDLTGFSENLFDVYETGDPIRVMEFLEEHKKVLLFHKLLAKAAVLQHQRESLPNVPWS